MPEKASRKTVAIRIRRERLVTPRTIVTSGFRLRPDKATGLIDVFLEVTGCKGERVVLDPVLLRSNLDVLKRYAAGVTVEPDERTEKDEVSVSETASYANIAHFSHMGSRAETIFGLFSLTDWVDATRQDKPVEITSADVLVVMSTTALQKKLLQDLVLTINQQAPE